MQYFVKLSGALHHGGVATLIYKMQFRMRNQPLKLSAHKRRCNSVVVAPDEQGFALHTPQFIAQVVTDSAFGKRNNFNHFAPLVHNIIHFIHQFFGGYCRIIESEFCFAFNIVVVAPFGVCLLYTSDAADE